MHRLHPLAAVINNVFTLGSRLLQRLEDIRNTVQNHFDTFSDLVLKGPLSFIQSIVEQMNLTRVSAFVFRSPEGVSFNLLSTDVQQMRHFLRTSLRNYVLRTNSAFCARQDMVGGPLLTYDRCYLCRNDSQNSDANLFDMAALRNMLTGAVHTEQRRFKANCASTPQCPWCESQDDETIEHLFWVCPKWQHLRQPLMNEYANVLALLPPCMRECGLFPNDF